MTIFGDDTQVILGLGVEVIDDIEPLLRRYSPPPSTESLIS